MTTNTLTYIESKANWTSQSLGDLNQYIYTLNQIEIDEIGHALAIATATGKNMVDITQQNFPLPVLSQSLKKLADGIRYGRGFAIIRGLPIRRYSIEQASTIFWGICLYLGNPAPQNTEGDLIYHVKDLHQPGSRRYSRTNNPLPFHTDGCDIISLLTYGVAARGGRNHFVSSVAIYNRFLKENPSLLELLTRPLNKKASSEVVCNSFDQYAKHSPFDLPIFRLTDKGILTRYAAGYIASTIEKSSGKAVTDDQQAALNNLNAIANDEEMYYTVNLQPGDMEFFNNNQLFHARDHYEDEEDNDHVRHIIRIWLDAPDLNTIPPLFGYRKT